MEKFFLIKTFVQMHFKGLWLT